MPSPSPWFTWNSVWLICRWRLWLVEDLIATNNECEAGEITAKYTHYQVYWDQASSFLNHNTPLPSYSLEENRDATKEFQNGPNTFLGTFFHQVRKWKIKTGDRHCFWIASVCGSLSHFWIFLAGVSRQRSNLQCISCAREKSKMCRRGCWTFDHSYKASPAPFCNPSMKGLMIFCPEIKGGTLPSASQSIGFAICWHHAFWMIRDGLLGLMHAIWNQLPAVQCGLGCCSSWKRCHSGTFPWTTRHRLVGGRKSTLSCGTKFWKKNDKRTKAIWKSQQTDISSRILAKRTLSEQNTVLFTKQTRISSKKCGFLKSVPKTTSQADSFNCASSRTTIVLPSGDSLPWACPLSCEFRIAKPLEETNLLAILPQHQI